MRFHLCPKFERRSLAILPIAIDAGLKREEAPVTRQRISLQNDSKTLVVIPESQLIVLLARGSVPNDLRAQAHALLATGLNWDSILEQVAAEEVYPLFYRNLDTLGFPGVPERARAQLHQMVKINALRSALMTEELARLLERFSYAGIPALPLKGVALAESYYGDAAARVCSDIDVLVPRQAAGQAFRLLLTEGFAPYDEEVEMSEIDLLLDSNIEYSFTSESQGFTFLHELHWDIAWRWQGNGKVMDDLWAEAQRKSYRGAEAYTLSPEWELLYLAVHAARHQWQGLKWLVDIHELCASSRIDWEKASAKAQRLGLEPALRLTLSACHTLFGTQVPARFILEAVPAWLKIFPARHTEIDIWKNNLFPARFLERRTQKLTYLARIAFLPTLAERRFVRLPSWLDFLYYPLRPLRLGFKWSWSFLRGGLAIFH
jgi:hypothetical protein